jgi:hypothetical protein
MSCGGGHLGFPIGIKNAKLYMNVQWMVLYKLYVFCYDMKFKMAATAELNLTLDPMGNLGSLVSIVQVVSEKKRFETFFP